MRKRSFFGLFFAFVLVISSVLITQAQVTLSSVKVLFPNGYENLSTDRPYTVHWTSAPTNTRFSVALYKNNVFSSWLTQNTASTSYTLNPAEAAPTGFENDVLKVEIRGYNDSGAYLARDLSDYPFSVNRSPIMTSQLPLDNTVLQPGAVGVKIGSYIMTANTTGDVSLNRISISVRGGDGSIQNMRLTLDGAPFGTPRQLATGASIYGFYGLKVFTPRISKILDIYADILSTASPGTYPTLTTFNSCAAVQGSSPQRCVTTVGQTVTIGGNNVPPPIILPPTTTVPTIPPSTTSTTPSPTTVSSVPMAIVKNQTFGNPASLTAGKGVRLGSYLVSAPSAEDVRVTHLTLQLGGLAPYLQNVRLMADTAQFGFSRATVSSNVSYGFSGLTTIPRGTTKTIYVVADIRADAPSGAYPTMTNLAGCSGSGLSTSLPLKCLYTYGQDVMIGTVGTVPPVIQDTTTPSVPTNLTLAAPSCSQVTVSWGPSTDTGGSGFKEYRLYRSIGGSNLSFLKTVSNISTTDVVTPKATYLYAVSAVDHAGNESARTLDKSITMPACPDTTAPTIPSGLRLVSSSASTISLTWNPSTDGDTGVGVKGYRIFRNGSQSFVGDVLAPQVVFVDTGLVAGTTYSYRVTAYDSVGNASLLSVPFSARTVLPNSTKFNFGDRVRVTTSPSAQVRATPSISGTSLGFQSTGATGVVRGGSTYASGYFWWDINYDTGADGWSAEDLLEKVFSDTTPPNAPTGLRISAPSCSEIRLEWNSSVDPFSSGQLTSGLRGYKLYR
ncbi:MAG: hypothetical protein AAB691_04445, partial [Patescibacteria group bacterium]